MLAKLLAKGDYREIQAGQKKGSKVYANSRASNPKRAAREFARLKIPSESSAKQRPEPEVYPKQVTAPWPSRTMFGAVFL